MRRALRKTRHFLRGLGDNDDAALLATADAVLGKDQRASRNGAAKKQLRSPERWPAFSFKT